MQYTVQRSRTTKTPSVISDRHQKRSERTPLCKGKFIVQILQKPNSTHILRQYREGALTERKIEKPQNFNHRLKSTSPERTTKSLYNPLKRRSSCKNLNIICRINTQSKAESPEKKEKDDKSPISSLSLKKIDDIRKSTPCFNNVLKEFLLTPCRPKNNQLEINTWNKGRTQEISFNNLCSPVHKIVESFDTESNLGISLGDISEKKTIPSTDFTEKIENLKYKLKFERSKNKILKDKINILNNSMKKDEKSQFLNSFECFNRKIKKMKVELNNFKEHMRRSLNTELDRYNDLMKSFKETCLTTCFQKISELNSIIKSQKITLNSLQTFENTEKYEKRIEDLNKKLGYLHKNNNEYAKIVAESQKELEIVKSLYEEDKKMWEKERKVLILHRKEFECSKRLYEECDKTILHVDFEEQVRNEVSEKNVKLGENKEGDKNDSEVRIKELEAMLENALRERDEYRHKLVNALLS
ncbi:hypothetical protein SteCoe_37191 [Stentor coeruleus]|uniref:Uncharacterized protein n=1 Tax=Stentor coeruleus TaxID=5963 RepID=A0A1R2ANK3_9CILI|nr:hypothetical protein SteCoe_37191 [Stentor coeruleus]